MKREKFGSRIGFILISAGCAIGLGNVWRFPYITGQYGGAAFVLIYLCCLVLLGFPIMVMEFSVGRAAGCGIARALDRLEPLGTKWHWYKWFGIAGNYLLMMFYTTIGGWLLIYLFKMASGSFEGMDAAQIEGEFGSLMGQPVLMTICMAVVVVLCFSIVNLGLQKGVEGITKIMMVMLFILLIILAVRSILLPGAMAGLEFYLLPDFGKMKEAGIMEVISAAMNLLHPEPRHRRHGDFRKLYRKEKKARGRSRGDHRARHLCGADFRTHHLPGKFRVRRKPGQRPEPDLHHPAEYL